MDNPVPPIYVQSSKLADWLLSRKLLRNDYPKRLNAVKDRWTKLCESLTSDTGTALAGVTYIHALDTVTALHKQDSSTDFFGRVNPVLRAWKDLVASYEHGNLHLAELSESIHEIASVCVPRCKIVISDRQKLITDLRQKVREQTSNASNKEDMLSKAYQELHIDVPENRIKLHLLEAASSLPTQFEPFVNSLKSLRMAVELYQSMCNHVFKRNDDTGISPTSVCPTLNILLNTGHVTLFEYEHGTKPDQINSDDDFIKELLVQERLKMQNESPKDVLENGASAETDASVGIQWVDTDPTEAEFEIVESPNEADFELELEETANMIELKDEGKVASGKSARLLLDTVEGRTALANDLTELGAFLTRFLESFVELHGLEGDERASVDPDIITAAKAFTGSTTIPSNILQNAPESIRNASVCKLAQLLNEVERARSWFSDSSRNQLFMVRSKPGYLDRLMSRLSDLRTQVERAKGRIAEAQLRIKEAELEQEAEATALCQYRLDCKTLVSMLEKELTRICNRPVQIAGQVLDL